MATATRTYRTAEDWDQFALELLPEIQNGTTIEGLRDRIGASEEGRCPTARDGPLVVDHGRNERLVRGPHRSA